MSDDSPRGMTRVGLGPTGETVRGNIRRLRERLRFSYAELSRRLDEVGQPIPALGLRRIEAGARRVDVDDLVALAVVFGVSPLAILLPDDDSEDEAHVTPAITANQFQIWRWALIESPLLPALSDDDLNRPAGQVMEKFVSRSLPPFLWVLDAAPALRAADEVKGRIAAVIERDAIGPDGPAGLVRNVEWLARYSPDDLRRALDRLRVEVEVLIAPRQGTTADGDD